MFAFLKKFFSFKRQAPDVAVKKKTTASAAPSTSNASSEDDSNAVAFNKTLIKTLVKDHKILLSEFTAMINAVNTNNFELANRLLASFASKIVEHLSLENIELYVYLEFMAVNITADEKNMMKGFRAEMSEIASAVTGFINTYTNDPIGPHNQAIFLHNANESAGILVDRIGREEKALYPMYNKYKK